MLPQPVEGLGRARQRVHAGNHLLDVADAEPMLLQDPEPHGHQLVVVGNVAGGRAQGIDTRALGEVDPDLGDQDAFQIETCNFHGRVFSASRSPRKQVGTGQIGRFAVTFSFPPLVPFRKPRKPS
jgi:hypothetical protein